MPEGDPPLICVQIIRLRGRRDLVHEIAGRYVPGPAVVELDGIVQGHTQPPPEPE